MKHKGWTGISAYRHQELLPEFQCKISSLTLEDFVKKALKTCPKGNVYPFWYFRERYENQLNNH